VCLLICSPCCGQPCWLCAGFGFLWNSPSYGFVNISGDGATWFSNATLNADFFIVTTPATPPVNVTDDALLSPYAQMLSGLVAVTGNAPTMPYYATGFIQVRSVRGHTHIRGACSALRVWIRRAAPGMSLKPPM
jgi:alpha-glucosidase (family GH31 glycosyl hydrolase)